MANHASALKRIRSSEKKRALQQYQLKTCRTFVKKVKAIETKEEATPLFNKVVSMLDKLAKKRIIHPNKSANVKSKLARHFNAL